MASRNIVLKPKYPLKIQFVISFAVVFGLLIRIFDFLSIVNPCLENLMILEYYRTPAIIRGTQRQFSEKYLFGRRFEI